MKLVFLHGSPATGKLTVAKALLRVLPGRLFDNHAAIDLARTMFDFGSPGFWDLVHTVRYAAVDAAAEHQVSLVVTTFCYVEPDDRFQFEKFEEIMARHGGALLPVFLHCSKEEAARRVGNADRLERRKMTSKESLIEYLDKYKFSPVPRPDCLMLDTEVRSAESTAGSGSDQDFSHPERFCKGRRTGVGGDYALIAAISGLVPMMFMTRVRL